MGLFCSTIADTQFQATQLVMMLAPPSILLSGFIFAREAMPFPIFLLGYFIPLTYFLEIIRGIVLKGVGFKELWPHLVPLMALAIVVLLASITKFRKRLA
jgi:ABC-2 type transport system permease protein